MRDEPKRNAHHLESPPLDFARDERVKPSKNRLLQRTRRPNRKLFDARAKRRFLEVFAATANARMGAEAAGVAYQTVFKHRARDAEFASAWEDALAQGYARLEAEVLAAALGPSSFEDEDGAPLDFAPFDDAQEGQDSPLDFARDEREGGASSDGVGSTALAVEPLPPTDPVMTVEQKLMILREYRRGFGAGRRAPSARPVVASQEEAIAALAKRLANFAVRGRLALPAPGGDLGSPSTSSLRHGPGQAGQGASDGGDQGEEAGSIARAKLPLSRE